ncbi:MAG TPA: AAA family ATPase [Lacipirellulaceae bacterium]|nr:AAA family ATPase [Lacipirellulaceae bacterium]
MITYLLSPDATNSQNEAIEAKLRVILPELRHIKRIEDLAAEIGRSEGKIVVMFLSPSLSADGIQNFINISVRNRDRVFFILISNEISTNDYKRLIRSGGADWVAAGGSLQEIPEIIYRQTAKRPPSEPVHGDDKSNPAILSFLPSMGGVGNSTIALEVALQIKLSKEHKLPKVCYIDLDFQTSHVCDFLDIEARLQIHEIFEYPERLDEQLFELFISRHKSGLDVFAAPRSKLDPCEINVAALDALLEMILERYDFVILDLPVLWFNWTIPTLENSSAILITGINTIPCLRQLRATLDAVLAAKASSSEIAIVLNKINRRLFGRIERQHHVKRVLADQKVFYVSDDPSATDRVNVGTPAALGGSSRSAKEFAKLASFCVGLVKSAPQRAAT